MLDGPTAVLGRSKDCDCVLRDPNVSRRHAELRRGATGDWQIVDLGSTNGVKVNGRQVDTSRALSRRRGRPRNDPLHLRHRAGVAEAGRVDAEPIAVALKFGFLAVLYLFLLWVARSALQELRRSSRRRPGGDRLPPGRGRRARRARPTPGWSSSAAAASTPGERFDLFGGLSIGRSPDADVRIEDRYASRIHARVYAKRSSYRLEDINSTNGTLLNGEQLNGEAELIDLDEVRIGDTEFRFELDVPG